MTILHDMIEIITDKKTTVPNEGEYNLFNNMFVTVIIRYLKSIAIALRVG